MSNAPRLPLAAAGIALGVVLGMFLSGRLNGQVPAAPPAAVPKDLPSYRDVVKRVLPAVVSIEAKADVKKLAAQRPDDRRGPRQLPPGVPDEFRRFFEGMESDPRIDPDLGFGSGVVVDAGGVILTNNHVVADADAVEVTLPDGRKFTSTDIRRDPKSDLAVVKVKADKPLPALEFGDSDQMEVGDRVLAVGAPFGLTGSVTQGIVSAKGRGGLKLNMYEDFIQTDAAINPGNSGGPLVNLAGQVIGINSAIKTRGGGSSGVGLAVSSNLAKDVAKQLMADGVVRRGYLGVGVKPLDEEVAARLGVDGNAGVIVTQVTPGGPAAKAGLQAGDVIVAVAGQPVKEGLAVVRAVSRLPLNQPAELEIVRDGKRSAVRVTVAEQPAEYGTATPTTSRRPAAAARGTRVEPAGLTVAELTPAAAAQLGFPADAKGVVVTSVDRFGPAADAGLARGVLVTKVDKKPVGTADEFAGAVKAADPGKGALLQTLRPTGESDFVVLKVK